MTKVFKCQNVLKYLKKSKCFFFFKKCHMRIFDIQSGQNQQMTNLFYLFFTQKKVLIFCVNRLQSRGIVQEEYLMIIRGEFTPILHKIMLWVLIRSTSARHF